MIAGPGATQRGRRQPRGGSHGGGCCCCCVAEAHTNHATSELFPWRRYNMYMFGRGTRKYRVKRQQVEEACSAFSHKPDRKDAWENRAQVVLATARAAS
jgi:hypothetical protein